MSFTDKKYPLGSDGPGGNMQKRPGPPRSPSRPGDDFGGRPAGPDGSAFIIEIAVSVLLIAAVCALRLAGVFSGEAPFDASIFIYFIAGAAVFAALRWFLRKPYYAGVIAAFLTLLVVKFDWLEGLARLLIGERYALAGGITFCFVFASLFCLLIHALYGKDFSLRIFAGVSSAVLCCVVVFSAVLSFAGGRQAPAASFADVTPSSTVSPTPSPTPSPSPTPEPTPEPFGLPNVYMFVLDEYSSFDMLKKYYKYDNQVFSDYLDSKGFSVARTSYTTDNQTEHVICDLLNIKYISRHYSKSKCHSKIKNAQLYKIFKDMGYTIFQNSSSTGHIIGPRSIRSSSGKKAYDAIVTDKNFTGVAPTVPEGITEQLSKSRFGTKPSSSKLNEWGFYPSSYIRKLSRFRRGSNADNILKVFDYFENPDNYAPTSPRVIFSYLPATHVPFQFNEYGGLLSSSHARNWKTEKIYLGQYSFISKHLIATVSTITANDPNSIIIIMSDHGIRYHGDAYPQNHRFYVSDKDSLRVMNAVYVKGMKIDITGLSAINTLRYILSLYEGHEQDYPAIKDPITTKSPSNLSGIIPRHRAPYKPKPKPKKTAAPDPGGS